MRPRGGFVRDLVGRAAHKQLLLDHEGIRKGLPLRALNTSPVGIPEDGPDWFPTESTDGRDVQRRGELAAEGGQGGGEGGVVKASTGGGRWTTWASR